MLTAQQENFCREYLAHKFNGAAAYLAAYPKAKPSSATAAASRLLANVKVQERIAELARQQATEEGVTPARVIRELAFIAFQRAGQIYRPDGTLKNPDEWDEATAATIAGIESEEEVTGEGQTRTAVTTRKVKRWDKV